MSFNLLGRVALVTGGARDIGQAISLELARNGADVVVNFLDSEASAAATVAEIEAMGRRGLAARADVTRKPDVDRLLDEALRFGGGRIDILVNNAGGLIQRVLLADVTEALVEKAIRVNFTSALLMSQAVIPQMVAHGGGRVINVSSLAGHDGGAGRSLHYAAAKAALSNLSRSLAKEFAAKGISVNTVAPGVIANGFHARNTSPEALAAMVARVPMKRAGTNEDVAGVVAFLASPAAAYVTGQVVHVNGGLYCGH